MSLQFLQPYFGLGNGLQTKNAGGGGVGGWVELGRTTLGTSNANIDVTGLSAKRYYMILLSGLGHAGASSDGWYQLGNGSFDTGSNYSHRYSPNGGADGTGINQTKMIFDGGTSLTNNSFTVGYLTGFATKEKLYTGHHVVQGTAGAGNSPQRGENVSKWVNTVNSIERIRALTDSGAQTWNSDSECVVLGWDPADTHSNNFWTEIGSSTTTGGTTLDITLSQSKKYNWVQLLGKTSAGTNPRIQLGNGSLDTANNYSDRYSVNGGADSTEINISGVAVDGSGSGVTNNFFINAFIINSPTKEKLIFGSLAHQNTAGAGTAPTRDEFVGKWSNTSVQFNHFGLIGGGGATFTVMDAKVWGAD